MIITKDKLTIMKENICINDLLKKDDIFNNLCQKYERRVFLVPTKEIAQNKSAWATKVVSDFFDVNRMDLKEEAFHFSYIKFAKSNKDNTIWGIVGGKSQFHHKNRSDVEFYDINTERKDASNFMSKNELSWYEDEILILKSIKNNSDKEARENEKILQMNYKLFP